MKQKFAFLILMLVGFLFIALTLPGILSTSKLRKNGIYVESTVLTSKRNSGKNSTYSVSVSFTSDDGKTVTAIAVRKMHVSEGERVMIWYDPADPQKITFGDGIGYDMRGLVIGVLIFLFGLYLFVRSVLADLGNNKLIRSGQKISAEFVSVEKNERYRMGDNSPRFIKCKWTDSRNNKEYFFVSKDYTIDPIQYLNKRLHLDVYIDPADPSKYYMDTSFMPKGNTIN
jgi:hypothetical protein